MKHIKTKINEYLETNYDIVLNNIINGIRFDYSVFDEYLINVVSDFLLNAAFFKNYPVCEYLINYDNVDLNKVNSEGETTLNMLAFQYGKNSLTDHIILELIFNLIDNDVNWNIVDETDSYFLDWSNDLEEILRKKYPEKFKKYLKLRKSASFNL